MRSLVMVALLAGCGSSSSVHGEAPAVPPSASSGLGTKAAAPPAVPAAAPAAAQAAAGPLRARTVEVTETLFGTTVSDPYRWMEGNDNQELTAWLRAQGDWTRAYLARLSGRDALLARIGELGHSARVVSRVQSVSGKLFYFETAPGEQLAKIMMVDGTGRPRLLVDPAQFTTGRGHASVDSFAVSHDAGKLAFNVAGGGGETATVHVLDIATGEQRADQVERVPSGAPVTWLPDGSGFLYLRKAAEERGVDPMLNPQLRLHVLGTPADQDQPLLGSSVAGISVAPNEWPWVQTIHDPRWLLASISGARSETRMVIAPVAALDRSGRGRTPWRPVADYVDGVSGAIVHGDRVYLLSYKGASNFQIVSLSAAHPDWSAARVELAEDPHAVLDSIAAARDAMYIVKAVDGRARLLRWAWRGQPTEVALPFDGWIDMLVADPTRDGIVFSEEGWTRPLGFYAFRPGHAAAAIDALATVTTADFSAIAADEVEAVSSDGTRVPLTILHRKDIARDGARPAIVLGYAGYGISETPSFSPTRLAWLERGGVFAICHGRGGGEKGHTWHADGAREHKMNGVHDFEACAQALVDARLSSPAHLFAVSGSMGGVLVGRAITDRPDLYAAAQIAVGVVNPLRLLTAKNGPTQIPEVGDPATESGFRALLAMDPYQHVTAAAYPATIFTIGLNDARVSPWMTGKMAARMQAMTTGPRPIAIRVDDDAGHGAGSTRDQAFATLADVWSFFLGASGEPGFAPH